MNAVGRALSGNYSWQIKIVSGVILSPILWLVYLLQQPVAISYQAVYHYYYVTISSLTAGVVGLFAYVEYKRTENFKVLLLSIGFMGGAVLYIFHGLITPGKSIISFAVKQEHINAFVFFGDMSRLWIAAFFIPQAFQGRKQKVQFDWFILASVVAGLLVASWMLLHQPVLFPQVKHANVRPI